MAHEASLKILKKDKRFAALIKQHGDPQLKRGMNPFQSLVRSIIYQQVSGAAAATILSRFEGLFPKTKGKKFPTPQEVLAMPLDKLRSAGLSMQKASYIKDLAEKFEDGTVGQKHFKKMTNQEVIEHVTAVKGIGVWTAHMFLIFTLERLDVLPTGDLGIQKGFQILFNLQKLPTPAQMEKLATPWREHASVASWYLWRAADGAKLVKKEVAKKKLSKKAKIR